LERLYPIWDELSAGLTLERLVIVKRSFYRPSLIVENERERMIDRGFNVEQSLFIQLNLVPKICALHLAATAGISNIYEPSPAIDHGTGLTFA
jgi:hypothetical protein